MAEDADATKVVSNPKRHSFSLKQKLNIVNEYTPGVKGKGFWALSRKYNVTTSTIRSWYRKKDVMVSCLSDPNVSIRVARRLKGGGKKHEFAELEVMLVAWVKDRNQKGLRVVYIAEAIEKDSMQTKNGNPKVPNYETVSNWVLSWSENFNPDSIKKSFLVCGIGPKEEFSIQNLHAPLRTILEAVVDTEEFEEQFGKLPRESNDYFSDNSDALWFWPKNNSTSFFECVLEAKAIGGEFDDFVANYCHKVVELINEKKLTDIFDGDDENVLLRGKSTGSEIEIYIVAQLEHWKITVTELDEECLFMGENIFTHEDPNQSVELVKLNDFYALKL